MTDEATRTDRGLSARIDAEGGLLVLLVMHHPDGRFVGTRCLLSADEPLLIGRDESTMGPGVLKDHRISRRHAQISCSDGVVSVADLGSHNGTWVNGRRVTRSVVEEGDVIGIGQVLLMVRTVTGALAGDVSGAYVGISDAMQRVFERAQLIAPRDTTVLVCGEPGVGKELVVRALSTDSGREGPLVAVDCGALTDTLIASELYGHVAGAYQGAETDKRGMVVAAEDGTLFLDEIGAASPELQSALLRFLDTREYRALGSDVVQKANVRVVAATNRDLDKAVADGDFRADLLDRLKAWQIDVPPLRSRKEDIGVLASHFAAAFGQQPIGLSRDLVASFLKHDWPGNVRELRQTIERMVVERTDEVELGVPTWWTTAEVGTEPVRTAAPSQDEVRLHAGTVNLVHGYMDKSGQRTSLSTKECALLAYMVKNPQRLITREEVLEKVWGYSVDVVTRAADTTMSRLRSKVERNAGEPDHLLTIFGEGYRFIPLR